MQGVSSRKRFRVGLVSVTLREREAEEVLRIAESAAIEGIEWGADRHVIPGDLKKAVRLRAQMADAGLATSAYGSYYRFGHVLGTGRSSDDFDAVLDTAEALGAQLIRVWAGEKGSAALSEEEWARLADRCLEIADASSERGIGIAFEYHCNTAADTPGSTIELLRKVSRDNVSAFWQMSLETPPEERLEGLEGLLPYVSNIHCNYFGQNPWPDMYALAEGEAEWKSYLAVLSTSIKQRWLSIEFVRGGSVEQLKKDATSLRDWLAEMEATS